MDSWNFCKNIQAKLVINGLESVGSGECNKKKYQTWYSKVEQFYSLSLRALINQFWFWFNSPKSLGRFRSKL